MKKILILTFLILALGFGALFIKSNIKQEVQQPVRLSKIRVVYVAVYKIYDIPLMVGENKGFFKKYNLDVKTQIVEKSPSTLLIGNKADVLLGIPYNTLAANVEGAKISWIGSIFNEYNNVIISSEKSKNIKVISPMNGAMPRAITTDQLEKLGVNPKNITFKPVNTVNIALTTLIEKKTDAIGGIPESDWLIFKRKNNLSDSEYKVIASTRTDEALQIPGGIIVNNSFLQSNRKEVEDFSKAIVESTNWAATHREEAINLMSEKIKVSKEDAAVYIDEYIAITKNLSFTPDTAKGQLMLTLLEGENPKAKGYNLGNFISNDISQSLSKSGFLAKFGVK